MSVIAYRREIDGLRALAVLPVILFHAGIRGFSGGFVGVDIFFVISGYLITSIILSEQDSGTFTLLRFYERRARRILPALMLVLLCTLPMAWIWLLPEALVSFGRSLVGVTVFASNVLFWRESGYFEQAAELKPLLHTWSLAVEEQYYVLFPLLLGVLHRRAQRWVVGSLLAVAAVSLVIAQWGSVEHPSAAFFLLPARAWELLLGSFVAIHVVRHGLPRWNPRIGSAASLLGLTMVVWAVVAFDKSTPFPGLPALLPTLGTVMIILFATPTTWVGRMLCHRWFVGIGLISFSAYLWHQPLFAFARHRNLDEPSDGLLLTLAAVSLLLGYLSWRYVERPFRDRSSVSRRAVGVLAVAGSLSLATAGAVAIAADGFDQRFPFRQQSREAFQMASVDNGWCFYSVDSIDRLPIGAPGQTCLIGDRKVEPSVLLFGDSFAGQYEPFWDVVGRDAGRSVKAITTNWCFPSLGDAFTGPRNSRAFAQCLSNRDYLLQNAERYEAVILAAHWGQVLNQQKMDSVAKLIEILSSRVHLLILMPSPKLFDADVNRRYQKAVSFTEPFDIESVGTTSDKTARAAHKLLAEIAERHPNVVFIDRADLYSDPGRQDDIMADGIPYSWDGSHISVLGAKAAAVHYRESAHYRELLKRLDRP